MRTDSFVKLKEAACLGFWREARDMSVIGFCEGSSGDRFKVPDVLRGVSGCEGFAKNRGHYCLPYVGIGSVDLV